MIEIRHFLSYNKSAAEFILPSEIELKAGDKLNFGDPFDEKNKSISTVKEIEERRPANGTWKKPYDFVSVKF